MKLLALLTILAALAGAPRAAAQASAQAPLPVHPELYSFADVYRLAVGEAAQADESFAAGPRRVSIAPHEAAGPRFSVHRAGAVEPWLLLLSGLAAAGWVAHRRLVNPL
jgi:hypothetical protein